ncbi:MAG: 4Fe-4S dicluster domain-containing protein [Anaerolineales bacterium]|nr:4Fe-4S dicluster domain-containing protein [Anaerolineales bacterium]
MSETQTNDPQPTKKSRKKRPLLSRGDALKIGGLTLAAAATTQVVISGPLSADAVQGIGRATHNGHATSGGATPTHQWRMVIDLSRCIGCEYCVRACQAVNDVPDDDMRWNIVFPERTTIGVDFYMNRPCQHCQEAPCTRVCPVGATWVRGDGVVVMDYDRCIGCRYCQVACPYDVRRFNWRPVTEANPYAPQWGSPEVPRRPRGVVEKCTFCVHRIDRGLEQGLTPGVDKAATPACVAICPVGARVFGDALDPQSPVSQYLAQHETFRLREEWGTQPKVHYVRPTNGKS